MPPKCILSGQPIKLALPLCLYSDRHFPPKSAKLDIFPNTPFLLTLPKELTLASFFDTTVLYQDMSANKASGSVAGEFSGQDRIADTQASGSNGSSPSNGEEQSTENETSSGPPEDALVNAHDVHLGTDDTAAPVRKDMIDIDAEEPDCLHLRVGEELAGDPNNYVFDTSPLKKRRKNARTRLLQHASYSALVEDRIVRLEEVVNTIRTAMPDGKAWESDQDSDNESESPDTPPETALEHDVALKAKSVRMTWAEFTYTDCPDEKKDHGIELCVERPARYQEELVAGLAMRRRRQKSRSAEGQSSNRVERIRFESKLLCKELEDMMGEDVAPPWDRMILRPFNPLFYYHDDLIQRCVELEKELCGVNLGLDAQQGSDTALKQSPNNETVPQEPRQQLPCDEKAASAESGTRREVEDAQATATTSVYEYPADNALSSETTESHRDAIEDDCLGMLEEDAAPQPQRAVPSASRSASAERNGNEQKYRLQSLQALLSMMREDLRPEFGLHAKCRTFEIKSIKFEDLWHLYAPGQFRDLI